MKNIIHVFGILLQIQLSKGEIKYCHEAVTSAKTVFSCPDSKEAWDIAARRKNCSGMALRQNCTTVEKFKYHCVINGFRNKLVEVCAPKRIIFGHCVEFNYVGGVIQDQMSAPCNSSFPKCDDIYHSTEAYKYPDCYALVSVVDFKASITTSTVGDSDTEQEQNGTIIGIISAFVVVTILIIIGVFLVLKFKRHLRPSSSTETQEERRSLMLSKTENGHGRGNKKTTITRRQRSSHSESSAYNAYHKKSYLSGRQRSSHSESSAYTPNVHRSYGHKRTPSLTFIGDRNEN